MTNESNSLDQIITKFDSQKKKKKITKFGNDWLHNLPKFNQISSRPTLKYYYNLLDNVIRKSFWKVEKKRSSYWLTKLQIQTI